MELAKADLAQTTTLADASKAQDIAVNVAEGGRVLAKAVAFNSAVAARADAQPNNRWWQYQKQLSADDLAYRQSAVPQAQTKFAADEQAQYNELIAVATKQETLGEDAAEMNRVQAYADADSLLPFQQDALTHALTYATNESSGWKTHLNSRNDAQYAQALALATAMQTRAIAHEWVTRAGNWLCGLP